MTNDQQEPFDSVEPSLPEKHHTAPGKPLQEQREIAARALIMGKSGRDAAREAGVSDVTVYAWRKKPEFQELMRSMLQEHGDQSTAQAVAAAGKAWKKVQAVLSDPDTDPRLAYDLLRDMGLLRLAGDMMGAPAKGQSLSGGNDNGGQPKIQVVINTRPGNDQSRYVDAETIDE